MTKETKIVLNRPNDMSLERFLTLAARLEKLLSEFNVKITMTPKNDTRET